MAFEQNELSGSLFINDRKTKSNQPDYTGTAKVQGVEYYMSAWVKEARNGNKFLSVALTEKDAPTTVAEAQSIISKPATSLKDKQAEFDRMTGPKTDVDLDEDMPF